MIDVTFLYADKPSPSQTLRYGKVHSSGSFTKYSQARFRPPVTVFNSTKSCNLKCIHCYSDSENKIYDGELTTDEIKLLIDDLADFKIPALLFSGGEPLMRRDIFELLQYSKSKKLRTVISTNGTLIDEGIAKKIKNCNVSYVGVSLDGIGEINDYFRGVGGSFQKAVEGIKKLLKINQKVGLRMTLTKSNYKNLPAIFEFIEKEKIPRVCFYHLVPVGRGASVVDLTNEQTRKAIDFILAKAKEFTEKNLNIEILTVDNHCDGVYIYLKLLKENPKRADEVFTFLKWNGGALNSSGVGLGCVDFFGNVHPDQFSYEYILGNVKDKKFSDIWNDNGLLYQLRNREKFIKGRCSKCVYFNLCGGGLRIRAKNITQDLWASEPKCYLTDNEIKI